MVEEQKDSAQKVEKLQLLKKLYTSPYRDRKDRNPERIDGTCEWFTNHPLFRDWQGSKTSSLLWVSADPGCGKSLLAATGFWQNIWWTPCCRAQNQELSVISSLRMISKI